MPALRAVTPIYGWFTEGLIAPVHNQSYHFKRLQSRPEAVVTLILQRDAFQPWSSLASMPCPFRDTSPSRW
jgi:hypothetical protein